MAGTQDGRKQGLIEGRLPLRVGGVGDAGAFGDADVVDEDVQPAEGFDRAGDDGLHPLGGRQIGGDGQHAIGAVCPGERLQGRGGVGEPRFAARANRHPAAFVDQRARAGEPEPLAGTSDEGDFILELEIHYRPPRPVRSLSVQSNALYVTLKVFFAMNSFSVASSFGMTKAIAARSIGLRPANAAGALSA